jgi:hypothetical protein
MEGKSICEVFREFVGRVLSAHGFELRGPHLAERRSRGLRQGILLRTEGSGEDVWAYVGTYSVFTHELDDGPAPGRLTTTNVVAGVCPGEMGSREDGLLSTLKMTMDILLPELNRYSTVDAIVRDVEKYPGSSAHLLGDSSVSNTFNHAYCLENVGRLQDARKLYRDTAERLAQVDGALARKYSAAATRRAAALDGVRSVKSTLPEGGECVARPMPEVLILSNADEVCRNFYVGLLRYLETAAENPAQPYPSLLLRAAEELYEPRIDYWRSLSIDAILKTVTTYAPDFEEEMEAQGPEALEEYAEDLENILYMKAFDEMCAERLLGLTADVRPTTRAGIYEWLAEEFQRRGEEDELEFLECDGEKAVPSILGAMRTLAASPELELA